MDELSRFSSTYVFRRDLAPALKTSPGAFAAKLASPGVTPIAGPGVDGCRQLLYRKRSVNHALPLSLIKLAKLVDCVWSYLHAV